MGLGASPPPRPAAPRARPHWSAGLRPQRSRISRSRRVPSAEERIAWKEAGQVRGSCRGAPAVFRSAAAAACSLISSPPACASFFAPAARAPTSTLSEPRRSARRRCQRPSPAAFVRCRKVRSGGTYVCSRAGQRLWGKSGFFGFEGEQRSEIFSKNGNPAPRSRKPYSVQSETAGRRVKASKQALAHHLAWGTCPAQSHSSSKTGEKKSF